MGANPIEATTAAVDIQNKDPVPLLDTQGTMFVVSVSRLSSSFITTVFNEYRLILV